MVTTTRSLYRLSARGAGFVLLRPHDKRPIEQNWPEHPRSLDAARRHLDAGGNVGILLGRPSNNLVCLDFDRYLPAFCLLYPRLARCRIYRYNAPTRGQVLLQTDEPLPNRRWYVPHTRRPAIELLADRKLAVVPPSRHLSGMPHGMRGTIPTVPAAPINAFWRRLPKYASSRLATTTPGENAYDDTYAPASREIEAVKDHWSALAVFKHFNLAHRVERAGTTDLRLREQGGLIVGRPNSDKRWAWYCFAEEIGGDQIDACGWCRYGHRWRRTDSGQFETMLGEMVSHRCTIPGACRSGRYPSLRYLFKAGSRQSSVNRWTGWRPSSTNLAVTAALTAIHSLLPA